MKVNIEGSGAVSGIGLLPIYGAELPENEIKRLLNFKNIRVYDASNGGLITKKRFEDSKRARAIRNHNAAIGVVKVVDVKPTVVTPAIVEEPVVEAAPVIEEPIVETPVVEVIPTEPEITEPAPVEDVVEEVVEEAPVEEAVVEEPVDVVDETEATDEEPKTYSKKKKNRK